MSVYKDKERNTYYFITRINGKQVKRRGFKTKKEALLAEAQLEEEGNVEEIISFEFIADEYLKWYKTRRKESSYKKLNSVISVHLKPYFKKKALHTIRQRDVIKFHDYLIESKLSAATAKKIHQILSALFNFAIKNEYTKDNPARVVGNIEMSDNKRMDYWTLDEFKSFIKHVDNIVYHTLFMTLYYSGMRTGELVSLTWSDIDFNNNTINVNKTLAGTKITTTKTESSTRIITMPNHIMQLLGKLKLHQATKYGFEPKMNYCVFGKFTHYMSKTALGNNYEKYVKLSDVKRIRLHDFRHSHASYLINKGVIISVVAARLGHANVSMTLDTYSHLYPSTEREAVAHMEDDFKPARIIEFKQKTE